MLVLGGSMNKVKLSLFSVFILSFTLNIAIAQEREIFFEPYDYIKLDMAYDQARTNNGNYVFWVNSDTEEIHESEFNMTARQTRLGANINYDDLDDKVVTARFEFDFYGGGDENKNLPMLRHGFVKIDFGKYYLLAGQSSDVFSPLVPSTVNYTVLWNCGNIGYRHPQIQFGYNFDYGFEIVGALSRNIPGDFDNDGNDDGENSSFPSIQTRVSYQNSRMNIGFSGHYGELKFANFDNCNGCKSYSINAHCSYSFMDVFQVKGELFKGKILNQYLGGIGQGFDIKNGKGIDSIGGWINASANATPNKVFNIGLGIDQPQKNGGNVVLERNSNRCVFGNFITDFAHNTAIALEISHWTTGYNNEENQKNDISGLRFHTSLIHSLK